MGEFKIKRGKDEDKEYPLKFDYGAHILNSGRHEFTNVKNISGDVGKTYRDCRCKWEDVGYQEAKEIIVTGVMHGTIAVELINDRFKGEKK